VNDFIADLEAELVSAARRRASRRRLPRPRLAPVIALAAVALAALLVIRGVDRSQTADDRPAPQFGQSIAVIVPAALDTAATHQECEHAEGWTAYAPADPALSVFARSRAPADALPGVADWLPATFVLEQASRHVGDLWVVPVVGPNCRGSRDTLVGGVCLVARAEHPVARCFSDAEVNAGKAIALTAPGTVAGIVPDGFTAVSVDGITADVADNVFQAQVAGVEAGHQVRVRLAGVPRVCAPSQRAYAAVPALGQPPTGNPTRDLEIAMADNGNRGAWRDSAREITSRDGLHVWVVPDEPCDRPSQDDERVCLLPDGGSLACETPAVLARRGMIVRFRLHGRQGVAGVVPAGTRRVEAQIRGLVSPLVPTGGVYVDTLQGRPSDRIEVRLR
jgi:hypothetical protein